MCASPVVAINRLVGYYGIYIAYIAQERFPRWWDIYVMLFGDGCHSLGYDHRIFQITFVACSSILGNHGTSPGNNKSIVTIGGCINLSTNSKEMSLTFNLIKVIFLVTRMLVQSRWFWIGVLRSYLVWDFVTYLNKKNCLNIRRYTWRCLSALVWGVFKLKCNMCVATWSTIQQLFVY